MDIHFVLSFIEYHFISLITKMYLSCLISKLLRAEWLPQGTLTERESSVWLTSSLSLFCKNVNFFAISKGPIFAGKDQPENPH